MHDSVYAACLSLKLGEHYMFSKSKKVDLSIKLPRVGFVDSSTCSTICDTNAYPVVRKVSVVKRVKRSNCLTLGPSPDCPLLYVSEIP